MLRHGYEPDFASVVSLCYSVLVDFGHRRLNSLSIIRAKRLFNIPSEVLIAESRENNCSALKMFKPIGSFFSGKNEKEESSYGDSSFTEAKVKQSGLLDDLEALGPNIGKDALTLIEKVASTGEPYDDRTFLVQIRPVSRWASSVLMSSRWNASLL